MSLKKQGVELNLVIYNKIIKFSGSIDYCLIWEASKK
jgi:hypothetical protein